MSKYKIGYKKPPKHTQFQKGQSGNPRGRPKGVKNIATDIKEELEEFVTITEGGRNFQVTKQRALIKSLLVKATQGNVSAAQTLLTLKAHVEQSDQSNEMDECFEEEDLEVIKRLELRLMKTTLKENNHESDT